MTLLAGQLRHKVDLRKPKDTDQPMGGTSRSYETYARRVPAEVTPLDSREVLFAGSERAGITHRVRLRYRSDIKSSHQVIFKGRVLKVEGKPRNIGERDRELEIFCEEVEGAG